MTSSAGPGEHRLGVDTAFRGPVLRVVLRGEADLSTLERLDAALEHAELAGVSSIHLDVSGLDFADSATVRRLTLFAIRAKETGRLLTTCGASPTFRMAARMLGVRDHLGLS